MRGILSKEQEKSVEEKKKRNVKILGIFLLLILAISSIGYAFLSSDQTQVQTPDIAEGELIEQNGKWMTNIGGQFLSFTTSPESVANITDTSTKGISDYFQQTVYYVDAENALYYELSQNLVFYTSTIQPACYGPCDLNVPEKTCADNLIIWNRTSLENKVYQVENCVFIEGDVRAVNAFLYRLFGLKR